MSTYEQFVQFGVDSFGLERTLRLLQSLFHIALSLPITALPLALATTDLLTLRSTLNLTRRVIRTFRFLSSFSAAHTLYVSSSPLSLESWLDVTKLTLLGLYGLLETATIPDMAGVAVFGVESDRQINLEAQRFWFLALVCGVLGGLLRFFTLEAEGLVPETGAGYSAVADEDTKGEKVVGRGEKEELKAEAEAKGKDSKAGKRAVAEQKGKTGEKKRALVRKVVTDAVDLALPLSALGWVEIEPVVVGAAMFVSTVVSGYDVWKAVGVKMRGASKA